MTDVFVATISQDRIRGFLCASVMYRWRADANANVTVFLPNLGFEFGYADFKVATIEQENMQRDRRIKADELSNSDIYVVTDDDCMPLGVDFIARGVAVMAAHPEFGVLAALNIRSKTLFDNGIPPYTGTFIDEDVWECHAVGGIRFCRKGIIKEWPPSVTPGSYDCQHQEALDKAGYKAGYMLKVTMNHLGEGLSTHWPEVPEIEQLTRATA